MKSTNVTIGTDRSARLIAMLCMLVLLLFSGLQAAHFHELPVRTSAHAGLDLLPVGSDHDTEANCPLCVNSGSALPACPPASLLLLFTFADALPSRAGRLVPTEVAFTQATRPPPVVG